MNLILRLICCLALVVGLCLTAGGALHAADAPIPASKSASLEELNARIEKKKSEQQALKKKVAGAESDLESSRKDLVTLTRELQGNEKQLTELETKIKTLQSEQATLNQKIENDYGSMSSLVLALQRIRRMPTEALIIRPGAPLETAQSALLLRSIMPAIHQRADQMSADLTRMNDIEIDLTASRVSARETGSQLQAQKKDLQTLLDKREKLYRQTQSEYDTQQKSMQRMVAEAQTLQQLLAKIQREEQRQASEDQSRAQSSATPRRARAKPPKLPGGRWSAPVQGTITTAFGAANEIGADSEGIRISARPNALVSAPVGGVIRFTGAFRNYGNMVIIEHDQSFHSLMAGLSRIDVSVGQKISAGEPVGTLSGTGAGRAPTLYYELRHNGKTVDPSAKFPDLSS